MMFSNIDINNEIPSVSNDPIKIDEKFLDELKNYNKNSKMNKLNKEEYRSKISKLYNDVGMIRPIDNEINNVIYFDDYEEVGLVLNKKNISLKQIWTEYRLIYNEKKKEEDEIMENSFVLDNFDELFDRLSKKVDGLDKYINDLNSLKKEVDSRNLKLDANRENFELEKIHFENYRRGEIARLEKMEKELNDKLNKINKMIINIDEKMNMISNDNGTMF